ncbi:hypothetical protein [Solirubrobacter soli]|uniref:hypothetical protein n=1 Tax=Solirubrobacter soli TaxID=363832 RepID=UPI0012F7996F|nr:hypothetical protein [Solirubrobacter soli]
MLRTRLTYANVVATLALFIALGGTSVAATSVISGSKIKKNSIPGDRVKKHALTATQVDVTKLGTVPSAATAAHAAAADNATHAATADNATHAATADNATHAATADGATHAGDADTVGGKAASAFTGTERFRVGAAESTSPTVQTILDYPDMGLRVETDGNTDFDQSVVVRNTTANQTLALDGDSGGANIFHGAAATLSKGTAWLDSQPDELLVIIQNLQIARDEVLLDCHFPASGSTGGIFTFCTGVRMDR